MKDIFEANKQGLDGESRALTHFVAFEERMADETIFQVSRKTVVKSLAVGVAILCIYTRKINYDPATIILIDIPLKKLMIGNLIMGKLHREECRDIIKYS